MSDNLFTTMDRSGDVAESKRSYSRKHFLRDMNDPKKSTAFKAMKLEADVEGATMRRLYERADWAEFVPTTFLEPILENTTYTSVSGNLANSMTIPTGLTFVYKEFENFQRAQRGGENTEYERKKGTRRTQEVPLYNLGCRSYATEEELLDIPVDSMRLELSTMGAALALEQDLLWVDSLVRATSGTNSTTFKNLIQHSGDFTVSTLHLCLTWFTSPFETSALTVVGDDPTSTERLMRLGKFHPTDVLVSAETYWDIVSNSTLQNQQIWHNSRILDTGELQVPLLGVNIHKVNMGSFSNPNDPDSWTQSNDIIIMDKRQGGTGTIGVRQPLQVRQWDMPSFRTQDFMIFERLGFAVQNRRALIRVVSGS